ncbi:MAG TPA: MBL fold metallo-hydrolase [Treponemataceae bacterium]|nr:MBL fold metallo-hydrolase [Treponemataceae bacterium]HQL33822.1 MBL fold metallo-hydrolase [Treponemataceae bacterium]
MHITSLVTGALSVNTLLIPADAGRLVIVDPGGNAESIIAQVRAMNASPALIVVTHGHFDHMAALAAVCAEYPGAGIAIHNADAQWLGPGAINKHLEFFRFLGAESVVLRNPEELPTPTCFLCEGESPVFPDGTRWEGWTVVCTPGHSPGSVCLFNEKERILVSGDTLFRHGYGRTDGPGGSMEDLSASLGKLSRLAGAVRVIPGHGGETTIAAELC